MIAAKREEIALKDKRGYASLYDYRFQEVQRLRQELKEVANGTCHGSSSNERYCAEHNAKIPKGSFTCVAFDAGITVG